MQTTLKTQLKVLVAVAIIIIPNLALGQPQIRQLAYKDTSSLVRRVNKDKWLVYSYKGDNHFYMVTPSGAMVDYKYLYDDNIKINDFEISESTVFFCGYREENGERYAMMGYFPLTNFPMGNVLYKVDSTMKEFKKMDIYHVENQVHVVMTALANDRFTTIVDVCHIDSTQWLFHVADGKTLLEYFDDVVVIGKQSPYVVFSSREYFHLIPVRINTSYSVWQFDAPTITNVPVFVNPCLYQRFDTLNILSPVLLSTLDGWYASVFKIANNAFSVSRFAYTGYNASVEVYGHSGMRLKDIRCNNFTFCLDVLTTDTSVSPTDSYIYHVNEFYFDSNALMYAHYYPEEDINSIDVVSEGEKCFIASGHKSKVKRLRTYRYLHGEWECATKKTASPQKIIYKYTPQVPKIPYTSYFKYFDSMEYTYGEIGINTICGE